MEMGLIAFNLVVLVFIVGYTSVPVYRIYREFTRLNAKMDELINTLKKGSG
jgi:cytochrome c oxidase assembly protein Cox11